ncbi:Crp/Fnr family transcriptional regulator [Endozoicomonas lisbonensis]|uniref:Crp/Fnr family transcriptional regulator n=1 Tax=Endozoicomonas lisbonensis TaxID=3120522 RepID=UPI003397DC9F
MYYSPPIKLLSSIYKTPSVEPYLLDLLGDQISEQELRKLTPKCRLIKTQTDGYICRQGELIEGILILLSGSTKTSKSNQESHSIAIHFKHSKHLINFGFFYGIKKHTTSVQAQTDCLSLLIKVKPEELNNYPALMNELLKSLSGNACDLEDIIESLLIRPLPERVMHKLTTVAEPVSRRVYATQNELAEMLGVSRQKVHAEIKQLVKNGKIKSGYGWFEIIDQDHLMSHEKLVK